MTPIAIFHSPFKTKFGIPRQSGVVEDVRGTIELLPPYNTPDAIRGIEAFERLWLIWQFSANDEGSSLLVRPPRLGGNEKVGVFASRSPFRPNRLGLSCVRLDKANINGDSITLDVLGADLMDGTPIYDIKPYIAYADAFPEARSGFVDESQWKPLDVVIPKEFAALLSPNDLRVVRQMLAQDPRPHYHSSPTRTYGILYSNYDIRFRVENNTAHITEILTKN